MVATTGPARAGHAPEAYAPQQAADDAFIDSPVLGLSVRLVRRPPRAGLVRFRVETRQPR